MNSEAPLVEPKVAKPQFGKVGRNTAYRFSREFAVPLIFWPKRSRFGGFIPVFRKLTVNNCLRSGALCLAQQLCKGSARAGQNKKSLAAPETANRAPGSSEPFDQGG
jgi:hypothetical protein